MRAAMIVAAILLAACGSREQKPPEGFAAACRETYTASADAMIGEMARAGAGGAERAAFRLMKGRIPAMCDCADEALAASLDARRLAIATELTPLRFIDEIAKSAGDETARRKATEDARARGAALIAKYSLGLAEMDRIAASIDLAVASCAAPGAARG